MALGESRLAVRYTGLLVLAAAMTITAGVPSRGDAQPESAGSLAGTLIVANRIPEGGSISLIDLQTNIEVARLPIGPRIPHEVAVSPDGRLAVTGEYGTGDNRGRRLVVIDIVDAQISGYVDLGAMSRPHSFAFLPDGRRVVATMEDSDRIAVVDLETLTAEKTYPTGGREGHMVRVSPDGAYAYVTSRGAEGTLSIISLNEDVPPRVVATGGGAEGIALAPNGTEVWVVNRTDGSISVVNTVTGEVTATFAGPPRAGRVAISAGGRAAVPSAVTSNQLQAPLTIFDLESRRRVGGQPISDQDAGAVSLFVVGERAIAIDRSVNSISIYNLSDLADAYVVAAEHPYPDGVAWSPRRVAVVSGEAE